MSDALIRSDWNDQLKETLLGLGFDLIELSWGAGKLLCITIDVAAGDRAVQVDDCALVSGQVSHLLQVLEVDYHRLEVSSPGLDRLLTRPADVSRFDQQMVAMTLKTGLTEFAGRRSFKGVLHHKPELDPKGFALMFTSDQQDEFEICVDWSEVKELRLFPNFSPNVSSSPNLALKRSRRASS